MTRLKEVISKLHAASPGAVKIKIQEADESYYDTQEGTFPNS